MKRIGLVALTLLLAVAGCTAGSSSGDGGNGSSPSKTILSVNGHGEGQTKEFTVGNEWSIAYSFNCANFGSSGNFAIEVDGTNNSPSLANTGANELAKKGHAVVYNHHGGTYYLGINSECTWKIKVRSTSGGSVSKASAQQGSIKTPSKTVLQTSGNGQGQTKEFTVGNEWSIAYSFNCANFGSSGNFAIEVDGTNNSPSLANTGANELAKKGHAVVYNHHGGTYYLGINSECTWKIKVLSG